MASTSNDAVGQAFIDHVRGGLAASLDKIQHCIDQLSEVLQVSVENAGFDTVGGFVLEQLGRIPSVGDIVHHDGMSIEVLSTVGRRLKTLKVTKTT